jgi:hypothetical protein
VTVPSFDGEYEALLFQQRLEREMWLDVDHRTHAG